MGKLLNISTYIALLFLVISFSNSSANNNEIELGELNEFESKHCLKVLRKAPGDEIKITNGCGDLFTGRITKITSKKCNFELVNKAHYPKTTAPLHIGIAPTKSNDRFEFFIEKCIEIGISEITPLLCFHSERKTIKLDRLKKIMISAGASHMSVHALMLIFPSLFPVLKNQFNVGYDLGLRLGFMG